MHNNAERNLQTNFKKKNKKFYQYKNSANEKEWIIKRKIRESSTTTATARIRNRKRLILDEHESKRSIIKWSKVLWEFIEVRKQTDTTRDKL